MTAESKTEETTPESEKPIALADRNRLRVLLRFPALVAIALYLVLLAGMFVINVVAHHAPAFYLIFSVLFITSAMGLALLLRWAWAMALGGVSLLSAFFLFTFSRQHDFPALMQGLLNLVFFLYLVRTEVREKLR